MMRIKIFLLLQHLPGGGVGRVAIHLLRNLDRRKFEPILVLAEKQGARSYELPSDVRCYDLRKRRRVRYELFQLVFRLARIMRIEKPNVILSFGVEYNFVAFLAKALSLAKTRIITNEQTTVSTALGNQASREGLVGTLVVKILRFFIKRFYPRADAIITCSKGVKDDLVKNFHVAEGKMQVIHNTVDLDNVRRMALEPLDHPWLKDEIPVIISVGRLVRSKGFPYLLKAFASIREEVPCKLIILGEGEDRGTLWELANELGIEQDVAMLGFQENPFKFMAKATVFVLSSLWEGFGNVIIEAMACGVPVVSTKCPYGPGEIIEHGKSGLLVPVANANALANAILQVLQDKELRLRLSRGGVRRVRDFAVDKIVEEYERVILECAEG